MYEFPRGQTLIYILILNNLKIKIGNYGFFASLYGHSPPAQKILFIFFFPFSIPSLKSPVLMSSIENYSEKNRFYLLLVFTLDNYTSTRSYLFIQKNDLQALTFSLSKFNDTSFSFSFLSIHKIVLVGGFFFLAMPRVPVIVVSYLQERILLLHRVDLRGYTECVEEAKHLKHVFTLKLFMKLQVSGWPVILLSRKPEGQRNATTELLISAGYRGWSSLIMRY